MCGLIAILNLDPTRSVQCNMRQIALAMAGKIRHRGPDWSGIYSDSHAVLAHERLSIVDVEHGAQPLVDNDTGCVLAVNGEIYNHQQLRRELRKPHPFQTASDCEVILGLYDELPAEEFLNRLNGIFAFVLYDPQRKTWLIARDPIGVVPLYLGWDRLDNLYVASEMKALTLRCERIVEFPPGHYLTREAEVDGFQRYYRPAWATPGFVPDRPYEPQILRVALEAAVRRQLMSDVPYGVLISGGVDSSIIAAIAAKYSEGRIETGGAEPAWWPRLHSFAIGLKGAPDLEPARKVAEHIGAVHHEVHFTIQEGLDALSDVIYHLETFDITTIRASTPMYLLMRKIRTMGIKMVLSGEGADEIFGGYLYFHKAPFERSVACSTAIALEWDAAFKNSIDPSGRAVADVHQAGLSDKQKAIAARHRLNPQDPQGNRTNARSLPFKGRAGVGMGCWGRKTRLKLAVFNPIPLLSSPLHPSGCPHRKGEERHCQPFVRSP